jgi:hypothetical protein
MLNKIQTYENDDISHWSLVSSSHRAAILNLFRSRATSEFSKIHAGCSSKKGVEQNCKLYLCIGVQQVFLLYIFDTNSKKSRY